MKSSVNVGDTVLFTEGRNGKNVGFTDTGKVILYKGKLKKGYIKVTSVDERDNYILVTGKPIIYDYYDGITVAEFIEVMKLFGYKLGFKRHFQGEWGYEIQLFGYNLNTKSVIIGETINNLADFNSLVVYCPGVNGHEQIGHVKGFFTGDKNMTQIDLCHRSGQLSKNSMRIVSDIINSYPTHEWNSSDAPTFWTYADNHLAYDDNKNFVLFDNTIDRYLLAPSEVDILFKGVERMNNTLLKRNYKALTSEEVENLRDDSKVRIVWHNSVDRSFSYDCEAYLGSVKGTNILWEDGKQVTKHSIAESINNNWCTVYPL